MTEIIATDSKVFAAADALAAEGIEPTLILIQERIGGSYTTIRKALKRWKEARDEAVLSPPPPELVGQGETFIRSLWKAAQTRADEAVQEAKLAAAAKAQAAEAALAHAEDQIRRLEEQCESMHQQLAQACAFLERERAHSADQAQHRDRTENELRRAMESLQVARTEAQQNALRACTLDAQCTAAKQQLSELLDAVRGFGAHEGTAGRAYGPDAALEGP